VRLRDACGLGRQFKDNCLSPIEYAAAVLVGGDSNTFTFTACMCHESLISAVQLFCSNVRRLQPADTH